MSTVLNTLEANKETILKGFNNVCNTFKVIGSDGTRGGVNETPRYFNFNEYDEATNRIYFASSQNTDLFFWVELDPETFGKNFKNLINISGGEVWEWFKKVRTNFLIDNHPTIEAGYEKFKEVEIFKDEETINLKHLFTDSNLYSIDTKGFRKMVLDCVDLEGHPKDATLESTLLSEYGHEVQRIGILKALSEWLRGLPSACTVPFMYCDIRTTFEALETKGSTSFEDLTEDTQELLFNEYWNLCAYILFAEMRRQKEVKQLV